MRTNERTYRQFMSFDDPDKKIPLHDLTCEYLAQDDKLYKLAHHLGVETDKVSASLSWPIPRDRFSQRSPFIVGYADVVARFGSKAFVLIEVKVGRVSIAQAIQQMATYQAFLRPQFECTSQRDRYVLATLYLLSAAEKETLAQQGIRHIYVAPSSVEAFGKSQEKVEDIPF